MDLIILATAVGLILSTSILTICLIDVFYNKPCITIQYLERNKVLAPSNNYRIWVDSDPKLCLVKCGKLYDIPNNLKKQKIAKITRFDDTQLSDRDSQAIDIILEVW